ncbi:MAG: flagellar biosynthesis protein FlhB [Bryobacteraceae bacterium]
MADRSGKTEQPTERRVKKAREEGQFPSAREFVSALQFMVFLLLAGVGGGAWLSQFRVTMRALLKLGFQGELGPEGLIHTAYQLFWHNLLPLLLGGLAVVLATLGLRLMTTRFGLSLKRLAPDPERLNPMSRLRDLPRQNAGALIEAAVLLPLFLWAVYVVARDKLEALLVLPLAGVEVGWQFLGATLMGLFWKAAAAFLVFGAADLLRQMRRYRRDLRMSKQDIKEELKDIEGNPQMKARIRRLQRERARRRMMKDVSTATAVVVNPTHFAVALRYQTATMSAPLVVAKGKNYLALRIRQKAIEHEVPIVENPPLAQALYHSVDVGQEIPPELYRAVAEILAYIFKLMNGRLPG